MIKLNDKYVLHIPCYKFEDNKLISLKNKNIINDLISNLEEKGYHSLYLTSVKGYYKKRCFDEILITIFSSTEGEEKPDIIFRKWFEDNNHILQQESYAYEHENNMIIEKL